MADGAPGRDSDVSHYDADATVADGEADRDSDVSRLDADRTDDDSDVSRLDADRTDDDSDVPRLDADRTDDDSDVPHLDADTTADGSDGRADSDIDSDDPPLCSNSAELANLEAQISEALDESETTTPYTLGLEHVSGHQFVYTSGSSSLEERYESASTSKWVAATIILRLVDAGELNLTDRPNDFIDFWEATSPDPRASITLSHLLSFTSGLTESPNECLFLPGTTLEACVQTIYNANESALQPGTEFHYGSAHLQVAGLMAMEAHSASWGEIYSEFQEQTGLFPTSTFQLPTPDNPRLAGGMEWTGAEYMDFLRAWRDGEILSADLMAEVLNDHTAEALMVESPAISGIGEDWHYGYGFWLECEAEQYNCTGIHRVSSPGAYGAYPFIDVERQYFGIYARQGRIGTFRDGHEEVAAVRGLLDSWADVRCE